MTVQTVPYALQNASHSAAVFRQSSSSAFATGGVMAAGELGVSAQSTPNMSVKIAPGRAKVVGSNVSAPSGMAFTTQGMYDVLNDADSTVTIAASNSTNPRIDRVYIQVKDSFYSGFEDIAVLGVVTGVPSSAPFAPALPATAEHLGYIAVGANVTSITNSNITSDPRVAQLIGVAEVVAAAAASGLVTVVPASIASVSGSSSVTDGGKVAFAGVTSLTLNGCFTSEFDNYQVVLHCTSASTSEIRARLRTGGVDYSAALYRTFATALAHTASAITAETTATSTSGRLGTVNGPGGVGITAEFWRPNSSVEKNILARGVSAAGVTDVGSWAPATAGACDGVTIISAIPITGTVRVYGYNNGG